MFALRNVSKTYGIEPTVSDIILSLGKGEKIALVGPNGVGKTTLLRILAREEEPDSGSVEIARDARIGYLSQELRFSEGQTVRKYLSEFSGVGPVDEEMRRLEGSLGEAQAAERYAELVAEFTQLNGYNFEHRVEALIEGFGLEAEVLDEQVEYLSGGQKSKVGLAGVLLRGADLLLLDEPTNNLDFPALEWLEYFVQETDAACVIVSHDRRFLDNTISRVAEIEWFTRSLQLHAGSYTDYLELKQQALQHEQDAYARQRGEIGRLRSSAQAKKNWAGRGAKSASKDHDKLGVGARRDRSSKAAGRAKAIERRIAQMDALDSPRVRDPFSIPLEESPSQRRHSISLIDVVAGYPSGFQLGPFSLEIQHGNRVGILGHNGSGKTTLLKVITGVLPPLTGEVKVGPSLVLGNVTQEHENLPLDKSTLDFLQETGGVERQKAYHLLDRFGFGKHESTKLIGQLSVGGRVRLLLALFSALSANVLVLDEPTNHLDVEGVQALEEILTTYTGMVILVSHDRHLLEVAGLTHVYKVKDATLQPSSLDAYRPSGIQAEMQKLMRRFRL